MNMQNTVRLQRLLARGAPAHAQGFKPTRPIEFVSHTGPGGGNDVLARRIAHIAEQEKLLPVRFQVVNKPGGGSVTAMTYMAEKKGEPHTHRRVRQHVGDRADDQRRGESHVQGPDADRAAGDRAGGGRGESRFAVQDAEGFHRRARARIRGSSSSRAARR